MHDRLATLLHDPAPRPWWRALLAVLVGVTCFFAFTPRPPELPLAPSDKLQHIAAFACLAACSLLCARAGWRAAWAAALGLLAFGGFIEIVQSFIPSRSADWLDLRADALGIACGLLAVAMARRGIASDRP